jgi:hypothetical protein
MDIARQDAAQMYRQNWNGCRQAWKKHYRWEHHGWKPENN